MQYLTVSTFGRYRTSTAWFRTVPMWKLNDRSELQCLKFKLSTCSGDSYVNIHAQGVYTKMSYLHYRTLYGTAPYIVIDGPGSVLYTYVFHIYVDTVPVPFQNKAGTVLFM